MRLQELLTFLREVEEFDLGRDKIIDKALLRIATVLSQQSIRFRVSAVLAIKSAHHPHERFAFYESVLKESRKNAQRLKSHYPERGNKLDPARHKRSRLPPSCFRAFASLKSPRKSGTLVARLFDRPSLQAVEVAARVDDVDAKVLFWQQEKALGFYSYTPCDVSFLKNTVFQQAWMGDFRELTFTDIHDVRSTQDCMITFGEQSIQLKEGANLLCKVAAPETLSGLIPPGLVLFGAYTAEQRTGNVRLWSAPHFPLKLGYFPLEDTFLAMSTRFDEEAWDAFGSLNAVLPVLGVRLPISGDMPVSGGFLSMNLETRECPPQEDLTALLPLVNNVRIFEAWSEGGQAFLRGIKQYELQELNLFFDIPSQALVSVSLGIHCGHFVRLDAVGSELKLQLDDFSVEWLVGFQAGMPVVTTDGSGKGRFNLFGEMPWEVSIASSPELCFECWAEFDPDPSAPINQWLVHVDGRHIVYEACVIRLYNNRTEVHALPRGQGDMLPLLSVPG